MFAYSDQARDRIQLCALERTRCAIFLHRRTKHNQSDGMATKPARAFVSKKNALVSYELFSQPLLGVIHATT
jgi:hypothetical protein